MRPGQPLLAARGAGRTFGQTTALHPVELELYDGEGLALVGANGAGKSTLLSLLAGALEPSTGRIDRRTGVRVGWAPQRPAQYGRLSARESGALSVGNRQRLNLAIAFLGLPDVLLLDEPTAALDPEQRRRLWGRTTALRDAGGAFAFATQNLDEIERYADRVAALRDGRLFFAGPADEYDRSQGDTLFA